MLSHSRPCLVVEADTETLSCFQPIHICSWHGLSCAPPLLARSRLTSHASAVQLRRRSSCRPPFPGWCLFGLVCFVSSCSVLVQFFPRASECGPLPPTCLTAPSPLRNVLSRLVHKYCASSTLATCFVLPLEWSCECLRFQCPPSHQPCKSLLSCIQLRHAIFRLHILHRRSDSPAPLFLRNHGLGPRCDPLFLFFQNFAIAPLIGKLVFGN